MKSYFKRNKKRSQQHNQYDMHGARQTTNMHNELVKLYNSTIKARETLMYSFSSQAKRQKYLVVHLYPSLKLIYLNKYT